MSTFPRLSTANTANSSIFEIARSGLHVRLFQSDMFRCDIAFRRLADRDRSDLWDQYRGHYVVTKSGGDQDRHIGKVLNATWRVEESLGAGSMGAVYAATNVRTDARAAVKLLNAEWSRHQFVRERFEREAMLVNRIRHPGVIKIFDRGEADGLLYLVMELLQGETFHARWKRHQRKLPVVESLDLIAQVLDALDAAHQSGIFHRDIKLENLFIATDEVVKVLDFGIARHVASKSTQHGIVLGTPGFMPPEQVAGQIDEVDARSDVWAVGACLFTMLVGDPVHPDRVEAGLAPARKVGLLATDLPPEVIRLIDQALEFSKEDRFASAALMARETRRVRTKVDSRFYDSPSSDWPAPGAPSRSSLPASGVWIGPGDVSTAVSTGLATKLSLRNWSKAHPLGVFLIGVTSTAALSSLLFFLFLQSSGWRHSQERTPAAPARELASSTPVLELSGRKEPTDVATSRHEVASAEQSEPPASAAQAESAAVEVLDLDQIPLVDPSSPVARATPLPPRRPFDFALVKGKLESLVGRLSACVGPNDPRSATMTILFQPLGVVSTAFIEGAMQGTAAGQCVSLELEKLRAPAFSGGEVRLVVGLECDQTCRLGEIRMLVADPAATVEGSTTGNVVPATIGSAPAPAGDAATN